MSTPSSYASALPIGGDLLDFRIQSVLGVGGFGITYLAQDLLLQKNVAIKEYFPSGQVMRAGDGTVTVNASHVAEEYRAGLDRFLQEARTLAGFTHPNIVRVNRFFSANGTGYMVMDYEEGRSLKQLVEQRSGALSEDEIRQIMSPLLEGIEKVHEAGFLHRDIKPENVFVRDDGTPVLIDFGSARRAVAATGRNLTALVSPGYAPFEQYTPDGDQGPWSDIYALAGVMYYMVTRTVPPDALSRIKSDTVSEGLADARSRYRPALIAAIEYGLAQDESRRPQQVAEWRLSLFGFNTAPPPRQSITHEPDFMLDDGQAPSPAVKTIVTGSPSARLSPAGPASVTSSVDIDKFLEQREQLEAALNEKFTRTLTVVFTDLKGSTTIAETQGDLVSRTLIKQHNEIVFPAIKDNNGVFIKSIGDGTLSYFEHALDAVRAAVRIQKGMDTLNLSGRYQVPVLMRIGMHTGRCIVEKNDIFGDTVNTASRFESSATPGDIYLSEDTYNAISDKGEIYCAFVKEVTLKGKKEPYKAYKAFWNPIEIEQHKKTGNQPAQVAKAPPSSYRRLFLWVGLALGLVAVLMMGAQFFGGAKTGDNRRTIEETVAPGR